MAAWEKRTVFIATVVGLSGLGAAVGAGSVYFLYVKKKLEESSHIQSLLNSQIEELKEDVRRIRAGLPVSGLEPRPAIRKKRRTNNRVTFVSGTKSDADEEFVTASESDSDYDEDAVIVFRRDKKAEQALPSEAGDHVMEKELDSVTEFLAKIDKLFEGSLTDQHEAYVVLRTNQDKLSDSYEFWWRFAKATHLEATAAGTRNDKQSQKVLLEDASSYAQKALHLNELSADAHKWYAIALGSRGEFVKTSEKIQNGYVFKEHIDRAITLKPNDFSLHHLIGRFSFEVSQLSWVERRVASTLFSEPPTSSVAEALEHFMNAEKIGPPMLENRLFIAKCYISTGDCAKAAHWLNLASQMPTLTSNDTRAQSEVSEILPKYRKYLVA